MRGTKNLQDKFYAKKKKNTIKRTRERWDDFSFSPREVLRPQNSSTTCRGSQCGGFGFWGPEQPDGQRKGGVVPGEQKAGPWGLGRKKNQGNPPVSRRGRDGPKISVDGSNQSRRDSTIKGFIQGGRFPARTFPMQPAFYLLGRRRRLLADCVRDMNQPGRLYSFLFTGNL